MAIKILFVCMGNICRSPAAEGVMKQRVGEAGLESEIEIDSAGTIDFHAGHPADARMTQRAKARGYTLTSKARGITDRDFEYFDRILCMDT